MYRTVKAMIDSDGSVRLLEPIEIDEPTSALLIVLSPSGESPGVADARLSEAALSDWLLPEEDAAWQHLQSP